MKKEAVPDRIMTHSTMNSPSPGLLSYWERISAPKGQRTELHAAATPSTTFNQPIAAVPPTIPPCACSAQFRRARPAGPLRLVTPELHGFAVAYPLLCCASHRVLSAVALPDLGEKGASGGWRGGSKQSHICALAVGKRARGGTISMAIYQGNCGLCDHLWASTAVFHRRALSSS